MRFFVLFLSLVCTTNLCLADAYSDSLEQIRRVQEYREKCPGGDISKPPNSFYKRSHQKINARTECIHPDIKLDVAAIPAVMMNEYMVSNYSRHDYILTGGVGPCVAITFYDPVTKTGVLAHLPPDAMFYSKDPHVVNQSAQDPHDKKFFENILEAFDKRGIPRERLEAGVYGNMPTRTGMQESLNGVFEKAGLTKIKFDNVRELKKYEGSIEGTGQLKVLDLKTGKVQSFKSSDTFILNLSGWSARSQNQIEKNKGAAIDYLIPTPGSMDQIPAVKKINQLTNNTGTAQ